MRSFATRPSLAVCSRRRSLLDSAQDKDYVINPALVARRGIYKDVHGTGAGRERADYQLRANQAVAMAVAPELFDPNHALGALAIYEANLVGPLGVKTLDPADPDYRGALSLANFTILLARLLTCDSISVQATTTTRTTDTTGASRRGGTITKDQNGCGQWATSFAPTSSSTPKLESART